jgi:alkanesulfonate monooxygenase SsuD/methylene tetrahydromethanopterin reductase-like flavin-dependent oxidoreductase (luciferase family)
MVEGQEGVTWTQWLELAHTCEAHGIEALFRSDHYSAFVSTMGGSLDAWGTVIALAAATSRLRLGTLVSPVTFRHPSLLARMAVTASHISGGRVELGLGIGWNAEEHAQSGFDFPPAPARAEMLAEQLEIIHRSWHDETFDFHGNHYELRDANPLPKPFGKINTIVGGSAKPGTVEPAVRFASEYNTGYAPPEEVKRRRRILNDASDRAGTARLTFSLMSRCVVGATQREVDRRLAQLAARPAGSWRMNPNTSINGVVDEVVACLREYAACGVERVMLQHLLGPDDLEMVELIGRELVPALA